MQCASTARCIDNCADCIRTADRHFAPKNTLHLGNILLPGTLYSMEHFTSWNTSLKWSRMQCILRSHHGGLCSRELKCSKEQSFPEIEVCWEAKCNREQRVIGSKCSKEQSVLRSKMCWGVKYSWEQLWVWKVFPINKVFWGAKCVSVYVQAM